MKITQTTLMFGVKIRTREKRIYFWILGDNIIDFISVDKVKGLIMNVTLKSINREHFLRLLCNTRTLNKTSATL